MNSAKPLPSEPNNFELLTPRAKPRTRRSTLQKKVKLDTLDQVPVSPILFHQLLDSVAGHERSGPLSLLGALDVQTAVDIPPFIPRASWDYVSQRSIRSWPREFKEHGMSGVVVLPSGKSRCPLRWLNNGALRLTLAREDIDSFIEL